ncbi:MAG: LEPR-XLL domain-containing protein, partial [Mesorhizobium sp.]
MAFPFKSEGISGRPISHRRAKLSEILKAKLARLAKGSRVQRELADRVRLIFDPLEPRLLLNADLNVNLATDGPNVDHEILVRLLEEVQTVNNVATTIQQVQIIDQTDGGKVLAFGDLSTMNSISITGGTGNDTLKIDEDSFGTHTLVPVISFGGAGGNDKVVFDSSANAAWTLSGNNAGSINGAHVDVAFTGTENLKGADGNNDTFTIAAAGKLSGTMDGGFGGHDTIVYSGGLTASNATLGANGSGKVTFANPNGSTLAFENMEPFAVGGGVLVVDRSTDVVAAANKNVTVQANGANSLRVIIDGANYDSVATSKVWLYLGDSANVTTLSSLPSNAGFSLMLDAGEEIAVNSTMSTVGSLGLSAEDINIGSSAVISAQSMDFRAVDWARTSIDVFGLGATLSATTATSATITVAGALTAAGAINVSSQVSNTVKAHGKVQDADHTILAENTLRTIAATLTDTSSVTLAATASITGSAINIAANTGVNVDLTITEVPIPNLLGLTDVVVPQSVLDLTSIPQDTIAQIKAGSPSGLFDTSSQAFSDALSRGEIAAEDLATMAKNVIAGFTNSQVASNVTVTNTTTTSVDAAAKIIQTGGVINDAAIDVQISAADDSRVAVDLQTETDVLIPGTEGIVIFSAISSNTNVSRTTGVTVGPATAAVSTHPTAISAHGDVTVAASSQGEVRNAIVSGALGSVTNVATDATKSLVRGVTVNAGGLATSAVSATTYRSTGLDSENRVTGETSAGIDESVVNAGVGGVSVLAGDYSTFIAIATPFQPRVNPDDTAPSTQVARVSVINMVAKTTAASISQSDVNSDGTVTVAAINQTNLLAYSSSSPLGADADAPVVAKNAVAGVLAVNVVNGSTTATIDLSDVQTTGSADVVVSATDNSFVDATIYVDIDGRGPVSLGMGSSKAVTGLEALNVIGFSVGSTAADIARATLDVLLGTQFWTNEQPVKVS